MIDSSQAGLLGTGSFAEVRRGTYAFSTHSAPTEVAFKIFRGSQQIDSALRAQVRIPFPSSDTNSARRMLLPDPLVG